MSTDTRQALAALVALKDMKDKAERGVTVAGNAKERGMCSSFEEQAELLAEYKRRKPIAWEVARAALSAQPVAQPSDELSVRAVEELLQLGYTVKDDLLYPPTEEQMPKELLDGGVDPAVIADYKHWVATRPSNWRELSAAQPSAQGEPVAWMDPADFAEMHTKENKGLAHSWCLTTKRTGRCTMPLHLPPHAVPAPEGTP